MGLQVNGSNIINFMTISRQEDNLAIINCKFKKTDQFKYIEINIKNDNGEKSETGY